LADNNVPSNNHQLTNALIMPTAWAIFVADAHRDDGKRFVVCADEKLTAFLALEAARETGLVQRHELGLVRSNELQRFAQQKEDS
jgi:hypothetical protein